MARKLEELAVYQTASDWWAAITALLDRAAFRRDRKLREQIADANDSIAANISEGFQQSTDRGFARYLYVAKGSAAEVGTRLRQANLKGHITHAELAECLAMGDRLERMLASFIRYLERSDFKDRGRFKSRLQADMSRHPRTDQDPGRTTKD